MANLMGFDATQVEPNNFEAIPNGTYNAIITDSIWKQTNSGNGKYLEMKFQIYDGDYKGRVLFARLNLENPNVKAVEIARSQLSSICRAVNVLQPKDSVELHNLPLGIVVVCRPMPDGTMGNDIKGFKAKSARASTSQAAKATDDTPPWKA